MANPHLRALCASARESSFAYPCPSVHLWPISPPPFCSPILFILFILSKTSFWLAACRAAFPVLSPFPPRAQNSNLPCTHSTCPRGPDLLPSPPYACPFTKLETAGPGRPVRRGRIRLRSPGQPPPKTTLAEARLFDARQFGATGNGTDLDTHALQNALDACGRAGGGIVRLTAGTYLSKPLFLRNATTLQLDTGALLKGTDEPDDYRDPSSRVFLPTRPSSVWSMPATSPMSPSSARASLTAPARAGGPRSGKPNTTTQPRAPPQNDRLSRCQGVLVQNVTLQNSPSFHLVPTECDDVLIDRVTIKAPADSPNTDAIDPSVSRHVRISHCLIDVGDDNVALKSGHARAGRPGCEDIVVSDCTMLHGHGVSIGSETAGGVNGFTVERCTFQDTVSGIRIKTTREKGGLVENLIYRNLTMTNVQRPIDISCYYPKTPEQERRPPITNRTPFYRNIIISNFTAASPRSAGLIIGLPEALVSNVFMENVNLKAPVGLTIRNAAAIHLTAEN